MTSSMTLRHLVYTGPDIEPARLNFSPGLSVIFGASNTGKSFAVKTVDFMLGGSRSLPEINERAGYDRIWLGLSGADGREVTLIRAIAGGSFELANGLVSELPEREALRQLSARHDADRTDNVSQFLLERLGLAGKRIAVDANGKKRPLSFRDVVRFCIVDETTIQGEESPAQSGQRISATAERSVFKLLLTGVDDSAIAQVADPRTFKASTSAKIEVFDEMITSIDAELEADYPDVEGLAEQVGRLDSSFQITQSDLDAAQQSIQGLLSEKRELALKLSEREQRARDVEVTLARFSQLNAIYSSDVERLEALEEAGFLLALGGDRECPLCGASPDVQRHAHGIGEIERVRAAAMLESEKIRRQRADLERIVKQLQIEQSALQQEIPRARTRLSEVETELARLAPQASEVRQRLNDLIGTRDRIRHGLALVEQKQLLVAKREELAALKPAAKSEKPRLGVSGPVAHDFAQVVSRVLSEWHFPGQRHVSFDEATYDLRIDGKLRRDNGKGVRAITHAAFKVALLIFCRERGLPHPGFVILDTPLLTYRDPIKSRAGALSADELLLANTSLKKYFFEHLAKLSNLGQFVIVENTDPPEDISRIAGVEVFYGEDGGKRFGLFPAKPGA